MIMCVIYLDIDLYFSMSLILFTVKKRKKEKNENIKKRKEKNLVNKSVWHGFRFIFVSTHFQIIDFGRHFFWYEIIRVNVYLEEVLVFLS